MPQISQILGANSVTNIEPVAGIMPAPIIRNADWFENTQAIRMTDRILLPDRRVRTLFLALYRIVACSRFARAGR
ncbi:hypothetical protein D3C85_1096390 [compost metagenome]